MAAAEGHSITSLSTELGIDRRTIEDLIAEHGINPVRVVERPTGDAKYYLIRHLWQVKSNQPEGLKDEKIEQEIRRLKRINDDAEALSAPVALMERALTIAAQEVSKELDGLPAALQQVCDDIDGKGVEQMQKSIIQMKNDLSGMSEQLLSSVAEDLQSRPITA